MGGLDRSPALARTVRGPVQAAVGPDGPSRAGPFPRADDVAPLVQQVGQLRGLLTQEALQVALEIRAVLTPEQLARAEQMRHLFPTFGVTGTGRMIAPSYWDAFHEEKEIWDERNPSDAIGGNVSDPAPGFPVGLARPPGAGPAQAPPSPVAGRILSLKEAINIALENQPSIQARLGDYAAARHRVDQAFSGLLPPIGGSWT